MGKLQEYPVHGVTRWFHGLIEHFHCCCRVGILLSHPRSLSEIAACDFAVWLCEHRILVDAHGGKRRAANCRALPAPKNRLLSPLRFLFAFLSTLQARSLTGTASADCESGRPASTRRAHCPARATKIAGPPATP